MFRKVKEFTTGSLYTFALVLSACLLTVSPASAQEQGASTPKIKAEVAQANAVKRDEAANEITKPGWSDYKGVRLGMSMDEVRDKLDGLKEKGKVQDLFVFSDSENGQIFYDEEGKVKAIAVNYFDGKKAPNVLTVLGQEVQAKEDGSLYKMVRYPEAGYWVAYSRTAGDAPLVTVTMQKM
jgi:hypothetical protein